MKPRRLLTALLAATFLAPIAPPVASAAVLVKDPWNLAENLLTALRTYMQLQNEWTMLTQLSNPADRSQMMGVLQRLLGVIAQLTALTDKFADRSTYEQVFGPIMPGTSAAAVSSSWDDPRLVGHATTQNTFRVLREQLEQSQIQGKQILANLEASQQQPGIVGSIQAGTMMLGTLGDQLTTVQTVLAQSLRLANAAEARALQKDERAAAAFELQMRDVEITAPASQLRKLLK